MKDCLGLTKAYRLYNKKTNWAPEYRVTLQEYRDICKEFNKMVVEEILQGKFFKIPFQLGFLVIKKYKINWNRPPLDIQETCKQKKRIFHTNQHSDEFYVGWKWQKCDKSTANIIFYEFNTAWHNKKATVAVMRQPNGHKRFFTDQKL